MQGRRKESDECGDIPSLKFNVTGLSPAGPDEIDDWVRTFVALRESPFAGHSTLAGTETGGEAGEPKATNDYSQSLGLGRSKSGKEVWLTVVDNSVLNRRGP